MPRLFGTDGIRGIANRELTPDLALAVGRAAGFVLAPDGAAVVGRDTRVSGPMLEAALVAGLCSAGADVMIAGILPTPAVAFLTVDSKLSAGGMISASHNPVSDNGIKFFSDEGMKITVDLEDAIERHMSDPAADPLPTGDRVGTSVLLDDGLDRYVAHLVRSVPSLAGVRVVLDCAYGAAWEAAPRAFEAAGADVVTMNAEPDGLRINVECGSTSPAALQRRVIEEGASLGLAFDGDADRVLAVDEHGEVVDGDRIIALLAHRLRARDELEGNVVVTTVMANLGFHKALEAAGIEVVSVPVGDRYVSEAMVDRRAVLGGEQSGHVILGHYGRTGDGVLTGLHVAAAVAEGGALSELGAFTPYPQVLVNVSAGRGAELDAAEGVWEEVADVERSLGDEGRVLVRASGTEPLVRVMVEAADEGAARVAAERIAGAVERHLGRGA